MGWYIDVTTKTNAVKELSSRLPLKGAAVRTGLGFLETDGFVMATGIPWMLYCIRDWERGLDLVEFAVGWLWCFDRLKMTNILPKYYN